MTFPKEQLTESEIIQQALKVQQFTDLARDGAEWINEKLPATYQVSYATVNNWVNDKHEPMEVTVRALQMFYTIDDPRHQLGADIAAFRIRKMEAASRIHWAKGAKV